MLLKSCDNRPSLNCEAFVNYVPGLRPKFGKIGTIQVFSRELDTENNLTCAVLGGFVLFNDTRSQ